MRISIIPVLLVLFGFCESSYSQRQCHIPLTKGNSPALRHNLKFGYSFVSLNSETETLKKELASINQSRGDVASKLVFAGRGSYDLPIPIEALDIDFFQNIRNTHYLLGRNNYRVKELSSRPGEYVYAATKAASGFVSAVSSTTKMLIRDWSELSIVDQESVIDIQKLSSGCADTNPNAQSQPPVRVIAQEISDFNLYMEKVYFLFLIYDIGNGKSKIEFHTASFIRESDFNFLTKPVMKSTLPGVSEAELIGYSDRFSQCAGGICP